jgi:hypothetical protein
MIKLLLSMPWPAAFIICIAIAIVIIALLIIVHTIIKSKISIKYRNLYLTSPGADNPFKILANYIALYQSEREVLHQNLKDLDWEKSRIEFKLRTKDQMIRAEKTISNFRNIIIDNYSELLKKHYGKDTNLLDTTEYRAFIMMTDEMLSRNKSMIRDIIVENHLLEMNNEQLKDWKESIINNLLQASKAHYNMYYPEEFQKPSISEFLDQMARLCDTRLKDILSCMLDSIIMVAEMYDEKLKILDERAKSMQEAFNSKWNTIFQNMIEHDTQVK